ncbi:transporter substrate-binding domain-containing protein [Saccharothrix syringae]|nr:transporter substrate-binding domain-containing protein [Saccharothrix syringae]
MDEKGGSTPSRPSRLRLELFWLGPAVLGTVLLTALLLLLPSGANLATVMAVPIGVAALILAVLPLRLKQGSEQKNVTPAPRRTWIAWTAAVVVPALVVFGYVQFSPTSAAADGEPDPLEYLKAHTTIDIGINGKLPGWSKDEGGQSYSGFDIKLAFALAKEFDFTPNFVPIDPSERAQALPDRKTGRAGRVKLVISNYSITDARKKDVDFAGPYFLDHPGFLVSTAAKDELAAAEPAVCMTRGVTANNFQSQIQAIGLRVQNTDPNLDKCMEQLVNPSNPVTAVATDYTILQAYAASAPRSYPPGTYRVIENLSRDEISGIGLPNHSPELCKQISAFLDKFIRTSWESEFANELAPLGVSPNGRKPVHTDPAHCKEPTTS